MATAEAVSYHDSKLPLKPFLIFINVIKRLQLEVFPTVVPVKQVLSIYSEYNLMESSPGSESYFNPV